jgi:hypothetical protein
LKPGAFKLLLLLLLLLWVKLNYKLNLFTTPPCHFPSNLMPGGTRGTTRSYQRIEGEEHATWQAVIRSARYAESRTWITKV